VRGQRLDEPLDDSGSLGGKLPYVFEEYGAEWERSVVEWTMK
jgi:hypothetical protein